MTREPFKNQGRLTDAIESGKLFTDLATLEITAQGLRLIDVVDDLSREELVKLVGLPIAA